MCVRVGVRGVWVCVWVCGLVCVRTGVDMCVWMCVGMFVCGCGRVLLRCGARFLAYVVVRGGHRLVSVVRGEEVTYVVFSA